MFKYLNLLILFISISSTNTMALDPYELSRCLGRQELFQHKNRASGSEYMLTQNLLNEVLGLKKIAIAPFLFRSLCSKNKNPSFNIIKNILTNPEASFIGQEDASANDIVQEIEGYKEKIPLLLNKTLLALKKQIPNKCLKEKFKWLNLLEKRIYYLQENISLDRILNESKKFKSIFSLLESDKKVEAICSNQKRSPTTKNL